MGITRSSAHKRKPTGGKKRLHEKKRKHNSGRPAANTKIGTINKVKHVRVRGGNLKRRALRLTTGSFSIKSENLTKQCCIIEVMYHPTNNELMRTNTLTKSAVVRIDATPFKECTTESKQELPMDFKSNFYARVTSRPGQVGTCDGYLLEGKELNFYMDKFKKKRTV